MISLLILSALAQTAGAPPAQQVTVTGPEEHKICRREEVSSASRISRRRVCLTPEQWRERRGGAAAANSEDGADDLEGQTRTYSTMPTNGMSPGGTNGGTLGPR